MTTLSLNKQFKDLDGADLAADSMAKVLATNIVQHGRGDAIKFWEWAIALNKGGDLTLDSSDLETLKKFIKEGTTQSGQIVFNVFTQAQLLLEIKDAEKQA
jgi:hypothetical protein